MRGKHFSIIYIPVWVFLLLLSSLLRTTVMSLLESEREVLTDSPHRLYCAWWFVFDGVVVVGGHYRCCSPIPRTMFKCNCGCKVHFFFFVILIRIEGIYQALYISRSIKARASNTNMPLIFECRPKVVYWRWLLLLLLFFFISFRKREGKRKSLHLMHMWKQMIRWFSMKHLPPFSEYNPFWYDISIFRFFDHWNM